MKSEQEVEIADATGAHYPANMKMRVDQGKCYILFSNTVFENIELDGHDFFDCLLKLRLFLESKNFLLLCKASMKNVSVSSMSSQMGHGVKAYCLEMNQPASLKNMVNIFDYAPLECVSTVEEQRQFYKEWIESLRSLS